MDRNGTRALIAVCYGLLWAWAVFSSWFLCGQIGYREGLTLRNGVFCNRAWSVEVNRVELKHAQVAPHLHTTFRSFTPTASMHFIFWRQLRITYVFNPHVGPKKDYIFSPGTEGGTPFFPAQCNAASAGSPHSDRRACLQT